jgi:two-component system CheB/CheR fusion protein
MQQSSSKSPDEQMTKTEPAPLPIPATFPIVGIGASAGGLEALELFLAHTPAASGLAFVIVQHLDPTQPGILTELLQRSTSMPVVQIMDGVRVQPNCVYVIPPNRDLAILEGVLHLMEPTAPRGLRLPIDSFFHSLALDRQEASIGVILSGMGSDGTLGVRAIKEKGGAVFVQTPDFAKFDAMPRSALSTGLVDAAGAAEKLPEMILNSLGHLRLVPTTREDTSDRHDRSLDKVLLILRTVKGHAFTHYKKSTVHRRVERRMGLHQLSTIPDYARYLQENPEEANLLFKELLIGVTKFFRDPVVWAELKTVIFPELMALHPEGGVLRAWSAGCSTGEEAFSLAMIFREFLEETKPAANYTLQIFATDLDHDAVDKARTGLFPTNIVSEVSEERLQRFFTHTETGFQISKDIREVVIFAEQNLIADPPFSRLDLLLCRNLLIYLDGELQKTLIPLFYYSILPGGMLLLGTSETIGASSDLLTLHPGPGRFYRREGVTQMPNSVAFPAMLERSPYRGSTPYIQPSVVQFTATLQSQTDALLLNSYAPAAVLTTRSGDIVYVSGKTGKYLEPAAGKANLNIFAMAREGLGGALNVAFGQAARNEGAVHTRNVKVGANGGSQHIDLTVQLLTQPAVLQGMVLVVFRDIPAPPAVEAPGKIKRGSVAATRIAALETKLQQAEEGLQIVREEMQTSQEELQSTNEELQSANEELQSTNEEMTTSKEEMQSLNEELQTVNQELIAKVDGLSRANDDMNNLLNSSNIATLFLDMNLKVRRFTPQMREIVKLIPGDIGRPITDLFNKLIYPELADDAREVLRSQIHHEREVMASEGRCYRVRIMSYHTHANYIDGLVVTFIDITTLKGLEAALEEALAHLQGRFNLQNTELEEARALEVVLRSTQSVLEKRLAACKADGPMRFATPKAAKE